MSEQIKIGYGYRRLEVGEIVIAGDEFLNGEKWCVTSISAIGNKIGSVWVTHRRRINAGDGYRLLSVDERVQEGDEYIDWDAECDWNPVSDSVGYKAGIRAEEVGLDAFRRKVVSSLEGSTPVKKREEIFYVIDESDNIGSKPFPSEEEARLEAHRRAEKYKSNQLVLRATLRIEPVMSSNVIFLS